VSADAIIGREFPALVLMPEVQCNMDVIDLNELEFIDQPYSVETSWSCLGVQVRNWFRCTFGMPTAAQRLAWPAIHGGTKCASGNVAR